ncbi:SPOR domain-containing protein [Natroniella acetigena]|uniref:SPOR domain-containing protein n=1 Tax=Natroniella acetigena TaxID=52004 RepID=UPI00200B1F58|nr:SPOR domain-containing protein [Natroniella acetigena]MCK8827873.1 SPOR domain-containing protein [Natroniella acetigena]
MKRNNRKIKSGLSLVVMLGCMAVIASVFGYFISSWFLDYVTAPQEEIQSTTEERIMVEEEEMPDNRELEEESGVTIGGDEDFNYAEEMEEDMEEGMDEESMEQTIADEDLYTVQVGAFGEEENAQGLVRDLEIKGFTAYITSENPYRVQVGAFREKAAAEQLGDELEKSGFPAFISN